MRISTAFKCALFSLMLAVGSASSGFAQQWLTNVANIGSASTAPSLAFSGETYTFSAAGTDIAGTSDQFGFVHDSVSGDTEIVARVDSIQNTSSTAKSGVMIRESLAANAAHVAIVISPTTGARFIYRNATGGNTTTLNTTGIAAPQWVRLVRDENYFTGYTSSDGVRWRMIGTVTLPLATNTYLGIAVCSRTSGTLCQSQLSRVDFLDTARPALTTYNWPAGIPQSDKYQVKVIQNGVTNTSFVHMTRPEDRQNLGTQGDKNVWYTHGGRTFSWSSFACWGPVTVEVKKLFGTAATLTNITLSPKSYGLVPQLVDGNTIRFELPAPRYVSVKFDVTDNRVSNRPAEIKHGLMIFADPPELSAPRTNDPGVVEWNPNVNQTSASVLYLLPGKSYLGPGATNANGSFSTNDIGGNYHLAANQSIYLAGGAYAWFSDWGPAPNTDTFIGGRGIVSGVKQVFGFWTPGDCCWQAFETQDGYEGVTFVDVPHHALGFSANAVVRRIKIASWHTNQDGLRGGQNTLAENNFLKCNDDYYYPGLHVRRTVIWPMWNGSTTQLGWGGYNNSNTRMYDCDLINPEWDHANKNQGFFGGANLWWSDKGDNHSFENIRIEGAINRLVNINMVANSGGSVGYLRNVTLRNVTLEKRQFLSKDNVFSKSRLQGVVLDGVPCLLTNWLFENLKIEGEWITGANAATHFDIDPATTTNINFLVSAAGIPVAPYKLIATPVATNQIDLAWEDDSGTETAFEIRRATNGSGPWTVVGTTPTNIVTFAATSLLPGTTYLFSVRATNSFGASAWSPTATATTPFPSDPPEPPGLAGSYTNLDTLLSATWWRPATNPAPPHPDAIINFGTATNLPWTWDSSSGVNATLTYGINRASTNGPSSAQVFFFGGAKFSGIATNLRLSLDVARAAPAPQVIGTMRFALRQGTNLYYTSAGLNNIPSTSGPIVSYELTGLTSLTLRTNGGVAAGGLTWVSQYPGAALSFTNGLPIEFGFRNDSALGATAISSTRGPVLDNFLVEVGGAVAPPEQPVMTLGMLAAGVFEISWSGTGFIMQTTTNLAGLWADMIPPPDSPLLVTPTNGTAFYRLRWAAP